MKKANIPNSNISIEPKAPEPPTPTAADVRRAAKRGSVVVSAIPLKVRLANIYLAVLAARAAAHEVTKDQQTQ